MPIEKALTDTSAAKAAEKAIAEPWETIPDIGLYMDQVIGYLNRRLAFLADDEDPLLTSSMVNNYVKAEILTRPKKKRYTREQLAELYMLCSLKQVLEIQDASDMLKALENTKTTSELYAEFTAIQKECSAKCLEQVAATKEPQEEWMHLALALSVKASVCRATAVHLIDCIRTEEAARKKAQRKAEKAAAKEAKEKAKAIREELKKLKETTEKQEVLA